MINELALDIAGWPAAASWCAALRHPSPSTSVALHAGRPLDGSAKIDGSVKNTSALPGGRRARSVALAEGVGPGTVSCASVFAESLEALTGKDRRSRR